jgi:fluoroquinolone resistance protein
VTPRAPSWLGARKPYRHGMAGRRRGTPTHTTVFAKGRDLSGRSHERVAFVDVDLSETADQGAVFSARTFRGVRFDVSEHSDAAFLNRTFTRCNFFDTTFTGCKLLGSMFDGCRFDLLKVVGGDWSLVGLA